MFAISFKYQTLTFFFLQNFRMKVNSTEKVLAPGLSTQIILVYAKDKIDSYEEDRFFVSCEEGYIEVRLIA